MLFDDTKEVFARYGVRALPTSFFIKPDGTIYGQVVGALSKDKLKELIEKTKD